MVSIYFFDVVFDFDCQELVNIFDQVCCDVGNCYDFKDFGIEIDFEEMELVIIMVSDMMFQVVEDVL